MAVSYALALMFVLFALYPISRIVTIALRPHAQLLSQSVSVIPRGPTLASFRRLFFETPFLRWVANSVFIALVVTLTSVVLASAAGYAISRFRFRGRDSTFLGMIVTQMFPATLLLLPLYLFLIKLGLLNSYLGLIIIYIATALPFCIWQLKSYYDTIPFALEEAARLDGCTRSQSFYLVILPLAAPALATTALFSFLAAWNEYWVAALIFPGRDIFTPPAGLQIFQSNMNTQSALYAAGALLVSLPILILFLALSRFLVPRHDSIAVEDP